MSFASTVLVYEFFTGGGSPRGPLPRGLAFEALGMLWALLADFCRLNCRTITALDERFEHHIPGLNRKTLPADEVVRAMPGEHQRTYLSLLKRCDAAIIIAPETNGILSELSSQAEMAGKLLLGSSSFAAALAGDKGACSRIFRKAGLPVPETRLASFDSAPQAARQIGFPLVVKPIDGVGSEGVCLAMGPSDLPPALSLVRRCTSRTRLVMQSFADGISVSVSLLVSKENSVPLSLNCQLVDAGAPFRYRGSQVPFRHPEGERAVKLACTAVKLFPGLKGYVGVDLVLKEGCVRLIEINPRLTTSYIGLRQISQINLARVIWDACAEGVLPDPVPLAGQVVIKKDDPETWNIK